MLDPATGEFMPMGPIAGSFLVNMPVLGSFPGCRFSNAAAQGLALPVCASTRMCSLGHGLTNFLMILQK